MRFTFILCVLCVSIGTFLVESVSEGCSEECSQFFYKKWVPQLQKTINVEYHYHRHHNENYYIAIYTNENIPVYYGHTFEPNDNSGRLKRGFVEAQMVMPRLNSDMKYEGELLHQLKKKKRHANQGESGESHVVHEYNTLNKEAWKNYTSNMSKSFIDQKCAKVYALVGAIPFNDNWIVQENVRGKKPEFIPEFIWNAFCCVDQNDKPKLRGAAIAKNTEKSKVEERTIDEMVKFLKKHSILEGTELFNGQCKA